MIWTMRAYDTPRGCCAGAAATLLVFDVNSVSSFAACEQLRDQALRGMDAPVLACCGLCGSHEFGDTRVVSEEEARMWCTGHGMEYFEVDLGVDDERVDTVFDTLIRGVLEKKGLLTKLNDNV